MIWLENWIFNNHLQQDLILWLACQADVAMIMLVWSFRTFLNTLSIIDNSRKAYRNRYFQSCWNASVDSLQGSGRQAIYRDSWWQSLEWNRSKNGFPKWLQISSKTVGQSFHLVCPGSIGISSLLFHCSDWVFILLSKVVFLSYICSRCLPCLINKRELSCCLSVKKPNLLFPVLSSKLINC